MQGSKDMPSCLLPSDLRTSDGSWGDGTFCCYKGAVDDVRSEEYVMGSDPH